VRPAPAISGILLKSPYPEPIMSLQEAVDDFLAQRRIAVAGVSRNGKLPANAIYRKLKAAGYETFAVNPGASEVEGDPCYRDLAAVPGGVDGVVAATPPAGTLDIARQCAHLGITRLWIHQGIGPGSASDDAVREARQWGIRVIPGACPMMFVAPVDPFHFCLKGVRRLTGKLPEPA
jgi:uncharacterized protein